MRRLAIEHTWDGRPLPEAQRAMVEVRRLAQGIEVRVDAPFHGDPPPRAPVGPTPELWRHEVVELFIAGPADRYLEIEMSPHGHHLVLWLEGVRRPVRERLPLELVVDPFEHRFEGAGAARWRAVAKTGASPLPDEPWRLNAYAVHGEGEARRWLAHAPVPGEAPDFHQLERFVAWRALPEA